MSTGLWTPKWFFETPPWNHRPCRSSDPTSFRHPDTCFRHPDTCFRHPNCGLAPIGARVAPDAFSAQLCRECNTLGPLAGLPGRSHSLKARIKIYKLAAPVNAAKTHVWYCPAPGWYSYVTSPYS